MLMEMQKVLLDKHLNTSNIIQFKSTNDRRITIQEVLAHQSEQKFKHKARR